MGNYIPPAILVFGIFYIVNSSKDSGETKVSLAEIEKEMGKHNEELDILNTERADIKELKAEVKEVKAEANLFMTASFAVLALGVGFLLAQVFQARGP